MSNKKVNQKREAYAKKQEQEGRKIVNWIFGVLVVLAIAFCAYSIFKCNMSSGQSVTVKVTPTENPQGDNTQTNSNETQQNGENTGN